MPTAIAITKREFAELVDVAPTGSPSDHEVVGRTLCTLVSPGTELAWNYTGASFPNYPGYAGTFEVTQVGSAVNHLKHGDIVFARTGHRSESKLAAEDAVKVPAGLEPSVAVLARLMGVSMTTLITTSARPSNNVVVSGLGPVGYLAAHAFQRSGYNVVGVDPIAERRDIAAKSGIRQVLDHIPLDGPDALPDIALVVECSGHEQAVLDACRCVRRLGEVVLVGVPWRKMTDLSAFDVLHAVFHKYAVLRSGWEWQLPEHTSPFSGQSLHSNYATALEWLAEGAIPTGGLVTLNKPTDAQSVYQALLNRQMPGLFAVFDWR